MGDGRRRGTFLGAASGHWGVGVAIGLGVGILFGIALDSIGIGIALGIAFAAVYAPMMGDARRRREEEGENRRP